MNALNRCGWMDALSSDGWMDVLCKVRVVGLRH